MFKNLKKLEELKLNNNQIKSWHGISPFSDLSNLQILWLNSNNFSGGAGTVNNFYDGGTGYLTGGAWPDGSGAGVSGFVFSENLATEPHNVYRHPISNITSGTNYVSSIFLNNVFDKA